MQSPFPSESEVRCGAFNLMAALDAYELASARLVEAWPDPHLYADVTQQIEEIREHGVSNPVLTVLSLQLVIAHSELVSALWQNASEPVAALALQEVRQRHAIALEALRVAAARVLRAA